MRSLSEGGREDIQSSLYSRFTELSRFRRPSLLTHGIGLRWTSLHQTNSRETGSDSKQRSYKGVHSAYDLCFNESHTSRAYTRTERPCIFTGVSTIREQKRTTGDSYLGQCPNVQVGLE